MSGRSGLRVRTSETPARQGSTTGRSQNRPVAHQPDPSDLFGRSTLSAQQLLIRGLQNSAGNAAVNLMLQRDAGWPGASKDGPAWNDAKPKAVGRIWRLAIAGLAGGTKKQFKDDESAHTSEGAANRAIVLVPDGFKPDPSQPVDVLLYFHGHTETWRKKYAGYRQRSFKPTPETKKLGIASDNKVRDVDLDQIEQQLDNSGKRQMIGILAQGGPQHQFGDINVDAYIKDVLVRTNKEFPKQLTAVPNSWSVILSGHSGGGSAVRDALSDENKPKNLKGLILLDAEAMQGNMRERIKADLKFLADPANTDADRTSYLAGRPSVRAFTTSGSVYETRYQDIVAATILTVSNSIFSDREKTKLADLRARQANQPLTPAEKLRLKELRGKPPVDPVGRQELQDLRSRGASRPLSAAEANQSLELAKKEAKLQSVTKFLPQVQMLYQLTALPPGVSHEEIIRNAPEDSGDYKKGQGNLEKALRSIP